MYAENFFYVIRCAWAFVVYANWSILGIVFFFSSIGVVALTLSFLNWATCVWRMSTFFTFLAVYSLRFLQFMSSFNQIRLSRQRYLCFLQWWIKIFAWSLTFCVMIAQYKDIHNWDKGSSSDKALPIAHDLGFLVEYCLQLFLWECSWRILLLTLDIGY